MIIRSTLSKQRFKQRGLATVELALVAPFLLVMMLVAAEFTRVFYQYNTLTKGVRDAARFAADNPFVGSTGVVLLTDEKKTQAENIAKTGSIDGNGAPLLDGVFTEFTVNQLDLGSAPVQEHIEVVAVYEYQPLSAGGISRMFFLPSDIDTNFTLRASSTMRAVR